MKLEEVPKYFDHIYFMECNDKDNRLIYVYSALTAMMPEPAKQVEVIMTKREVVH